MSEIEMTREQFADYFEQHTGVLKALLAQREVEIEGLKAQHEEMLLKHAREQSIVLESLEKALKEIERLKALLLRAVDVLQLYADYLIGMVMSVTIRQRAREILPELRKAAE